MTVKLTYLVDKFTYLTDIRSMELYSLLQLYNFLNWLNTTDDDHYETRQTVPNAMHTNEIKPNKKKIPNNIISFVFISN